MLRLAFVLMCCASLPTGWSSELRVDDVRLSYGYMPNNGESARGRFHDVSSDGSVNDHGVVELNADRAQTRRRTEVGWYWSLRELEAGRGSLVLGVAAVFDDDPLGRSTQHNQLGDVFVGWAWPLSPAWHVEEGIVLGAGRQTTRTNEAKAFSDGTTAEFRDTCFAYEYGIRIGVRWTSPIRVQLGVDVAYLVLQSDPSYRDTHALGGGVTERYDFRPSYHQEGAVGAIVLGYRL